MPAPDDTALLLIDMQRCVMPEHYADFGASRGLAAEDAAHALEEMRGHREATNAAATDVLAAARSAGIRPIHVRIRALLADGADTGRLHASKGFRMLPDLEGARHLEGLEPIDGEISLDKTCSGAVVGTNVDRILRNLGIRHVLVMGYDTDQCVSSSVRDLADLGYEVEIVEDACGALTPTRHEQALGHLRTVYAATERSEELIARMAD